MRTAWKRYRSAWGGGAVCVAVFAVLVLAGCGGSTPKPDKAACEAAMVQQWRTVMGTAVPAAPGTEPPACKGLDNAELQALWVQAGNEVSGS